MNKVFLSEPQKEYEASFQAYAKAYERTQEVEYFHKYKPALDNFDEYLNWLKNCENGRNGVIATSSFWLIVQDEVVGVVRIRHQEDPSGGHIGYDISPDHRKLGYGNLILSLALEKARDFQLEEVVVTCEISNVVSKKIIEGHGGIYTGTIYDEEDDEHLFRYVIDNKK